MQISTKRMTQISRVDSSAVQVGFVFPTMYVSLWLRKPLILSSRGETSLDDGCVMGQDS